MGMPVICPRFGEDEVCKQEHCFYKEDDHDICCKCGELMFEKHPPRSGGVVHRFCPNCDKQPCPDCAALQKQLAVARRLLEIVGPGLNGRNSKYWGNQIAMFLASTPGPYVAVRAEDLRVILEGMLSPEEVITGRRDWGEIFEQSYDHLKAALEAQGKEKP